jgi:hypothetical protein
MFLKGYVQSATRIDILLKLTHDVPQALLSTRRSHHTLAEQLKRLYQRNASTHQSRPLASEHSQSFGGNAM